MYFGFEAGDDKSYSPMKNSSSAPALQGYPKFLWLQNVPGQLEPPDFRKELDCVLYGVDCVLVPRAQPTSMVYQSDLKPRP